FLYFPLRNAHFIPVMLAAASKVPVLSVDIPGIEKFITSGKNGVVLSSYEIKSMGEKIIELMNNPFQRKTMAENLWNDLREKYSLETISEQYYRLFFKTSSISDWKEAA
ncbi:MAG: glycosyltransferase, partial [Deltaproteobacteria bacterium]